MKLGEMLVKIGLQDFGAPQNKWLLEAELVVNKAGEQADEVVHVEIVEPIHSIYLEYE